MTDKKRGDHYRAPEGERVLACARASDTAWHIAGSVGGHQCADCHAEIVIAKSGQRLLAKQKIKTICAQCAIKSWRKGEVASAEAAPGAVEEFFDDLWQRNRN